MRESNVGQAAEPLQAFAVAAPGLSPLVADELASLDLDVESVEPEGVTFCTDFAGLCLANAGLRTASRVLVRIARFRAAHFSELERGAREVAWNDWLAPSCTPEFRVTSIKSRLYHRRGIAERLERWVRAGQPRSDDKDAGTQLFVVRIFRDTCTISVDASGELLHRRGYREDGGRAPLRETLAAAAVMASGWHPSQTLIDPFCGSGTIPIEAALLSRGLPPGGARPFALEAWPCSDADIMAGVRRGWPRGGYDGPLSVLASDRDAGAVARTLENARRAHVANDVEAVRATISDVRGAGAPGFIVSNPPYGKRVGGGGDLRNLYDQFGRTLQEHFGGWSCALLAASPQLVSRLGVDFEVRVRTQNGGLAVALYVGTVEGA